MRSLGWINSKEIVVASSGLKLQWLRTAGADIPPCSVRAPCALVKFIRFFSRVELRLDSTWKFNWVCKSIQEGRVILVYCRISFVIVHAKYFGFWFVCGVRLFENGFFAVHRRSRIVYVLWFSQMLLFSWIP